MWTLLTQTIHAGTTQVSQPGIPAVEAGATGGQPAAESLVEGADAALQAADAGHAAGGFDINEMINHHLVDAPIWHLDIAGIDMSITKRVVMMWIASLLMFLIFIPAARIISRNAFRRPGRFSGIVEVFVNFVRKDVGEASMGHHSHGYEPYLLTMFFFILFMNLLGLIPSLGEIAVTFSGLFGGESHSLDPHAIPMALKIWPGMTATGDIGVTAALAMFSFLVIIAAGFIHQGAVFVRNIVPAGIPLFIWPIIWVIEVAGLIAKPFALAIRLLANMTAGHMIILVFMSFIFQFQNYGVAVASVGASVAIYMLEIFVAFLQAYIFVFLTAIFVAGVQHRH